MSKILAILSLAFVCIFSGCATTSTSSTGTVATTGDTAATITKVCTVAAPLIEGSSRTGTYLILKNNPDLSDEFAAFGAAASAIFKGGLTTDEIKATINASNTGLDDASVTMIANAIATAWSTGAAYYKAETGKTLAVSDLTNDNVDTLVNSLIAGIKEGTADYTASSAN